MLRNLINKIKVVAIVITFFFIGNYTFSQHDDWWKKDIQHAFFFTAHPDLSCGFDKPTHPEWNDHFETIVTTDTSLIAPVQSVYYEQADYGRLISTINYLPEQIRWYLNDSLISINAEFKVDTIDFTIPPLKRNGILTVKIDEKTYAALNLIVFKKKTDHLVIVSLNRQADLSGFQEKLNQVYKQAGIELLISNRTTWTDTLFEDRTFANPGMDHAIYTEDMRLIRDRFFEKYPNTDKNAYYLFLIDSFTDSTIYAYGANNKAMTFSTFTGLEEHPYMVIKELSRSIGILENSWLHNGPKKGSTDNLMDNTENFHLSYPQWFRLRHSSGSFSFYDSEEDLLTNNGTVAYLFWKEDADGNIILTDNDPLKSIIRPYKKNYFSYHLNINDELFQPAYTFYGVLINWWHIILWGATTILLIIFRVKMLRKKKEALHGKWKFRIYNYLFFSAFGIAYLAAFYLVNIELTMFEVDHGHIEEFNNMSLDDVRANVLHNTKNRTKNSPELRNEILIQQENTWVLKRRKPVLYFKSSVDTEGRIKSLKFVRASDSLILKSEQIRAKASTHYIVLEEENELGIKTYIFNHLGVNIKEKIQDADPAKRVLLFVNGYRPTSIGHSFQENFDDVISRGLEYPQSSNLIYTFDRYDYWQPWQAIDDKFKKRINPQETFYADGHFSVSTSNYRSLFNFSKTAAMYPERCKDPDHHTCNYLKINTQSLFGHSPSPTMRILPVKPNKSGFNKRMENGSIAGNNLLSILDELPGNCKNDTVYIVAHSMGFAYSLGIIEAIKDKVHLGGYIIIAPENGMSGYVNTSEWKYVWQYGSDYNTDIAACLQDGIAPQTKVNGLPFSKHCFIPQENMYRKQGFFDSHFIGYYTWILDIPNGEKGYIPQR